MTDLGKDISCTTTLRTGRFSTGTRLLGEALFRRLITIPGTLRGGEDEQNYGFGIQQRIGKIASTSQIAALPGQISAEFDKDPRVISTTVKVVDETAGGADRTLLITVDVESDAGPFELVISASAVTAALVGLKVAA